MEIIDPETLKETDLNSLPQEYQDRVKPMLEKKEKKVVEIEDDENDFIRKTPEGEPLDKPFRSKESGGGKITLNKNFNPEKSWKTFYATQECKIIKKGSYIEGKITPRKFYTKTFTKVHATKKFELVRDFIGSLLEIRSNYVKDMGSTDETKKILATMISMTDEGAFRAGSIERTRGKKPVYGLTTLQARHFKKEEDCYKINFIGKDSVPNHKIIKDPVTVKVIDELLKGKQDEDFVFVTSNNHRIDETELNKYVKQISGNENIRFHNFRHKNATQVFVNEVKKSEENGLIPDMPTVKEIKGVIESAALKASILLGNTKGACEKSYICPQCIFEVFDRYGLETPDKYKQWVFDEEDLKKMGVDLNKISDVELDEESEDEDDTDSKEIESVANVQEDDYIEIDFDKQADFESYMLSFEHNPKYVFVDPSLVTASFLVDKDWVPDFSDMEKTMHRGEDYYNKNSQRPKELDVKTQSGLDKWGYNDFPEDLDKCRKIIEDQSKMDLERITKEINK